MEIEQLFKERPLLVESGRGKYLKPLLFGLAFSFSFGGMRDMLLFHHCAFVCVHSHYQPYTTVRKTL